MQLGLGVAMSTVRSMLIGASGGEPQDTSQEYHPIVIYNKPVSSHAKDIARFQTEYANGLSRKPVKSASSALCFSRALYRLDEWPSA